MHKTVLDDNLYIIPVTIYKVKEETHDEPKHWVKDDEQVDVPDEPPTYNSLFIVEANHHT